MSEASDYGEKYFCIKVSRTLSDSEEIYVHGDRVETTRDGALVIQRSKGNIVEPTLVIASGNWTAIYAASVIDGSAVSVAHWDGEVITRETKGRRKS